jgi:hypothetical protein
VPAVAAFLACRIFRALAGDLRGDFAGGRLVRGRRGGNGLADRRSLDRLDQRQNRLRSGLADNLQRLCGDLGFGRPYRLSLVRMIERNLLLGSGLASFAGRLLEAWRADPFPLPCGAFLRNGFVDFFAADFRVAGPRALAPAGFLAAGLRGLGFAGDLRVGFAGFLAMFILRKSGTERLTSGGDRENLKLYHPVIRHHGKPHKTPRPRRSIRSLAR